MMRHFAAAVLIVLAACAPAPEAMTQQEAERFLNTFVQDIRGGDTTRLPTYFSPYATFISPRGRIDSRDSIVKFWTEAVKAGQGRTFELHPARFGSGGDVAWQLSHFTGGVPAPTGYLVTIMQRDSTGAVQTVAQLSVPDAPRQ